MKLYNHIAPGLSELEWRMVEHIPEGGNWQNIPDTIPSKRLEQIRKSGGRTTYYGRLRRDKPSFTITTYFNRLGNGCNLHPSQNRIISNREAARLQSFSDSYIFKSVKTSQYKQIGNAVPPLLGRLVAETIAPYINDKTFVDLFAGAGGMSEGFLMEDYDLLGANEIEKNIFETYKYNHENYNHGENFILGDITIEENKEKIISLGNNKNVGVVVGGPPCQGFSTAGWRDPNDKRNQLFKDFVHVVEKIRPEFFVMENVLGILSMRKGEAIKEIIKCFSDIGYHVNEPFKLHAEEYGVPQKRKRVVIIGSLKDIKIVQPRPLFSLSDDKLPNPITVEEAIGGLPKISAGDNIVEKEIDKIPQQSSYEEFITGQLSFSEFYKKKCKELLK